MGNSSTSLPTYSCSDSNISSDTITPEYWETHSISDAYRNSSLATAVIMLLFILIGLPGNAIIIVSIILQRLYKETTHLLLLNLAVSDFLVCLLIMPFISIAGFAGGYVFGDSDFVRCNVCQTGLIFTSLTVFSIDILAVISLDRFIFIKYPLRYHKFVTSTRIVIIVIFLWLLSIFEAILPLFGFGEIKYSYSFTTCTVYFFDDSKLTMNIYYIIFLVSLNIIPAAITVVTNIWIACIVRKQIRKVYRTRKSFSRNEDLVKYNQGLRKQIHKRRNKKQLVLVRAFGAILVANFIVWTPLVLHVIVLLAVDPDLIPLGMYPFVFLTFSMHSVLHPMIEGWFIPEIKMTFKKFLGITLCKRYCKRRKRDESVVKNDMSSYNLESTNSSDGETKDSTCGRGCYEVCSFAVVPRD